MMYYHEGNGMDDTTLARWITASLACLDETNAPPWTDATSERTESMATENGFAAGFEYITNPAARAWAEANSDAVAAMVTAVAGATDWHDREALAVTAWAAAYGHLDAGEQLREIHFQVMCRMDSWGGWNRERSEALDLALAPHLPLPGSKERQP